MQGVLIKILCFQLILKHDCDVGYARTGDIEHGLYTVVGLW